MRNRYPNSSPPLFLLGIGNFFQRRREAEGMGRDMKTLPVGSRPDYRWRPRGHAEFFGQLYPRLLIDNELEAYSDEFVRCGRGNVG